MGDFLDIAMFLCLCVALLSGFPVALTLGGTALLFAGIGVAFGVFDFAFLNFLPQRIFGTMTNEVLIAVPLFVFMGVMLERSKVAEDLLDSMGALFGTLRGGIGLSVLAVGALLAASTGIVGATVVTMGLISLPTMLRRGYDKSLASGAICAAGTLGQVIPPSIVLILLGDVISSANQEVQNDFSVRMALEDQGITMRDAVSVGDLFAGALVPGLVLVGLYMAYVIAVAILRPGACPPIPAEELTQEAGALFRKSLSALLPPLLLIVAVLGSILGGIATPTEAASVGAIGAILLAGNRLKDVGRTGVGPILLAAAALIGILILAALFDLRIGRENLSPGDWLGIGTAGVLCLILGWGLWISIGRTLRVGTMREVVRSTAEISSMVFVILIGAALFSLVFRGLGGDEAVQEFLSSVPGGAVGAMAVVMLVMFLLGFFLDFIEITFVVVPLIAPALIAMGFDPLWLGVMMAVNLQTSFMTPPFGFALFYLRGVAPPEVATLDIYKGALPFVGIQVLMLMILALVPELATSLPDALLN